MQIIIDQVSNYYRLLLEVHISLDILIVIIFFI